MIQMGARTYIPQLGRFLTPDPVRGGSANSYDYADQDPINSYDLNGLKKKKKATVSSRPHAGGSAKQKRCCGLIHVTIPNPFSGLVHLLSKAGAEAVTVGYHSFVKQIEETARGLEAENHTIQQAEEVMEHWEHKVNPFAIPNLGKRVSCLQSGLEAIYEEAASDGSDADKATYFATGCTEGAAEE